MFIAFVLANLCATAILNIQNQNLDLIKSLPEEEQEEFSIYKYDKFPQYSLRVKKNIQLCDPTVQQYAGYLDIQDRHFYFWFFESRKSPATDPVLMWLNGGPGCTSFTGLLMELGPCNILKTGNGTEFNPYSWNKEANIFFLDQPIGTGFSYSDFGKVSTSHEAAEDVYVFLRLFFHSFKKYAPLDFHITGESYAGHYIPLMAKKIFDENAKVSSNDEKINLKSIAIGNGITDALVQDQYYPDMAADTKYGPILTPKEIQKMRTLLSLCREMTKSCYRWQSKITCVPSQIYCGKVTFDAFDKKGLNYYDIRVNSTDPKFDQYSDAIEIWLSNKKVRKILGVDVPHKDCSDKVFERFISKGDEMFDIVSSITPMLESGLRILIYAGDADWICNWIGNKKWVLELDWSGKTKMNTATDKLWISNSTKKLAGEYRQADNLSFLRIYESSHFVPFDQPEHSLEFITAWINNIQIV